jgi:hypothetical protein
MRTFIFGAGASVHAGYPLSINFWNALESWVRRSFPEGTSFRDAVEVMNTEFDLSRPFELVLTNLDDLIESLRTAVEQERIRQKYVLSCTRYLIADMVCSYFHSLRSAPAELYKVFADDVLGSGDTLEAVSKLGTRH